MKKNNFSEKVLWKIWQFFQERRGIDILSLIPSLKSINQVVYPEWDEIRRAREKNRLRKSMSYLKMKGYLKIKIDKGEKGIFLTEKGMEKVFQIYIKKLDRKERRDKRWIMIIFDIPEKYRKSRDKFRNALKLLGYQKLQQSIWISPYDVLKETKKFIHHYSLEPYVKFLLTEELRI